MRHMPDSRLELEILPQPDDKTCGPTCLHAVYRFFGDRMDLPEVIQQVPVLDEGGTLAVLLGCHALRRGYRAVIYTYNLTVFDPTWFADQDGAMADGTLSSVPTDRGGFRVVGGHKWGAARPDLIERLQLQMAAKPSPRLQIASLGYIEFLQLGGEIRMRELNASLLRHYLKRSIPILTGLSSTYLYGCPREFGPDDQPDDVKGVAAGHFVVLCGYDPQERTVAVADPYLPNPLGEAHHYQVELDRLVCAILLGILTHDANLLIIEPRQPGR